MKNKAEGNYIALLIWRKLIPSYITERIRINEYYRTCPLYACAANVDNPDELQDEHGKSALAQASF